MELFLLSPLTLTEAFLILIGTFCFLAFNSNINRNGGVLSYLGFIFSNIHMALTLSASHVKTDLKKRGFSPHNQYLNKCYPAKNIYSLDIKASLSAAHPDFCYVA